MTPFFGWVLLAGETLPAFLNRAATFWYTQLFVIAIVGAVGATLATERRLAMRMFLYLLVVAICGHLLWGPVYYRAQAISTRVTEYPDLKPVPGARVEARWQLMIWGMESEKKVRSLAVSTAISDANGYVKLPGWWPRLRPPFLYFTDFDPEIKVTAPDGLSTREDNAYTQSVHPPRNPFTSRPFCEWSRHDLWLYTAERDG